MRSRLALIWQIITNHAVMARALVEIPLVGVNLLFLVQCDSCYITDDNLWRVTRHAGRNCTTETIRRDAAPTRALFGYPASLVRDGDGFF